MRWRKNVVLLLAVVGLVAAAVAIGADAATGPRLQPQVFYPVKTGVSPAIRSMPVAAPKAPGKPQERVQPSDVNRRPAMAPVKDPVVQRSVSGNTPIPLTSFDGLFNTDNIPIVGFELTPPDTEGAVGGNSPDSNVYIQWVNLVWAVYDKATGARTAGPFAGNIFWSGFGGHCETDNNGDPIVNYDAQADRWVVSQFSLNGPTAKMCYAVSTSPDPLGTYYQYEYDTGGIMPDYPKLAVWGDAYYGTCNMFYGNSGAGIFALQRDVMLTGGPAVLLFFQLGAPYGGQLPVEFDGPAPAPGTPGIFIEVDKAAWIPGLPYDAMQIWYLTPDWATPGNSCLGDACGGLPNEVIQVADFTAPLCGGARSCIPMPPPGESVDPISDRVMYRAQARNVVVQGHKSLVANHTVDAGGGIAGVRWYEFQTTDNFQNWTLYQQGTYSPDTNHRWMGSVAIDYVGDIAVGYSVSSSTVYPSVRYAARTPGDPLGTLEEEQELVAGNGVINTGYSRWGDYSAMQVDPTDQCTFWYTQEYTGGGGWDWYTRIGSFKFGNCSIGPTGTITGTVTNLYTGLPVPGVLVAGSGPNGASQVLTNGSGVYTMGLPIGTYDVTASKFGFAPATVNGVEVFQDTTTTQDFVLTPIGSSSIDGYVTDGGHGWPLYAQIVITAPSAPTQTIYTSPFNGYYDVTLYNGYNYTFTVTAMTPNYVGASRLVPVPGGDQVQSFVLWPESPSCAVLGYGTPTTGFGETFDAASPPALPPNWQSVVVSGGGNWQTNNGTIWWGTPAHSSPNVVGCNNYNFYPGYQMRLQMTVDVDMTTVNPKQLSYWFYETSGYCSFTNGSTVQPQISTNGGASWTNIGTLNNTCNSTNGWVQYTVDLSNYGSEPAVRIAFLDTSDWWNAVNIDDILLGAPGACSVLPGGLVAGFVKDGNTGTGLVGAKVADDLGGSVMTVDDPNVGTGYYSLFTPIPVVKPDGPSLRTFTASKKHYGDAVVQMAITPNTVNRLDFTLGAGWIDIDPMQLISRLNPAQDEHQVVTLTNNGTATANFKLGTSLIKVSWPHASPVKLTNAPKTAKSAGRAPNQPNATMPKVGTLPELQGPPAFAAFTYPNYASVTWPDIMAPGSWTTVAAQNQSFFGGAFVGGDTAMMYVVDYDTNTLNTIDTATGAVTLIGPSVPGGGESWVGLAGTLDGTLYGAATTCGGNSTLYTVDTGTGALTTVGTILPGSCIIDIAANSAGELYGVEIINDVLVKIDAATGAGTVIGPTGINANYAQGLSFDQTTDILYWAAYNGNTGQGELRLIDTTTGASTLVGAFPGGAEVDAFGIMTSGAGGGLPWLVLTPTEGAVDPAMAFPIDAHFIADGADHFGLFQATLKTSTDTPYKVDDVPVCFTKAFFDVAPGYFADAYIHSIAGARITSGCGDGNFCPGDTMTRGVMARWLLLARFGNLYSPPPCAGIFADVICESTPNADFIEALYNEGITSGCATDPLRYCPDNPVTRAQMSVFILAANLGPDYVPPPPACIFGDVDCGSGFAPWIEDLYNRGITSGCSTDPLLFCPGNLTTRAQEAVFVGSAWSMPLCPLVEERPAKK